MPPPAGRSGQSVHAATGVTRPPQGNVAAVLANAPQKAPGIVNPGQQRPAPAQQRPAPAQQRPAPGQQRPAGGVPKPPAGTVRPAPAGVAGQRPPAGSQATKPAPHGRPAKQSNRRAHLRITRLDLLSILKMAFLFAFCVGIVVFVALYVLWGFLQQSGVITSAQSLLNSVMGNPSSSTPLDLAQYLSTQRVVGFITAVTVLNVFVLTLLGTVFGMLYNLAAAMFGGLEVTLEV